MISNFNECGFLRVDMSLVQYWQLGSLYVNLPLFPLHHSAKEPIMQQTTEEISLQVRDGIVLSIEKKREKYLYMYTHKIDESKETQNWWI